MRRRSICLFACVLALALVLAGCGEPASSEPSAASNPTPEATSMSPDATKAAVSADASASCCDEAAGDAPGAVCVCAAGREGTPVWCAACKRGWVDGEEAACPKCVQRAIKGGE